MTEQTARANLDASKKALRLVCIQIANAPPADLDGYMPNLLAKLHEVRDNRDHLHGMLQGRAS